MTALATLTQVQRQQEMEKLQARWTNGHVFRSLWILGAGIALMIVHPVFFVVAVPVALVNVLVGSAVRSHRASRERFFESHAPFPTGHGNVRVLELPARRAGAIRTVRGKVRIMDAETSPLSGLACAAFRIVGVDGMGNTIDDAGMGRLQVVTAEGERVDLEGSSATIDIPVKRPADVIAPSPALLEFLRDRGIRTNASLRLAEALIHDGDEVDVSGVAISKALPEGYRDVTWALVLSDHPAAPLTIRRI